MVRQVFYLSFDSIELMAPTALAQKLTALIGLTAEALAVQLVIYFEIQLYKTPRKPKSVLMISI